VTSKDIRVALACVLLAVGLWMIPIRAAADALEDLITELQIIPLLDQPTPPLTLESLDGAQVSLAGLRGRAVFLYFWEST
jgi:hypothetical protein